MTTQVVNLKHEPYDVYIGRPSVWGNPFRIGKDGDRPTMIRKYAQWIPALTGRPSFEIGSPTTGTPGDGVSPPHSTKSLGASTHVECIAASAPS